MALLLCIETATEVCSVALCVDSKVVGVEENHDGNSHASQLNVLIKTVLKKSNLTFKELNAIAVSKGPGSYTGLRVGVSAAKGLCYALDIPLIAVNTLQSLAFNLNTHRGIAQPNLQSATPNSQLFCPMLDARRMEVYTALFDESMTEIEPTQAVVVEENFLSNEIAQFRNHVIYVFGNGAAKCKAIIKNPNAIFVDGVKCSAASMVELAFQKYSTKQFEDVAYFEPFYLKDFVGTKMRTATD